MPVSRWRKLAREGKLVAAPARARKSAAAKRAPPSSALSPLNWRFSPAAYRGGRHKHPGSGDHNDA